jgi:exosortase N
MLAKITAYIKVQPKIFYFQVAVIAAYCLLFAILLKDYFIFDTVVITSVASIPYLLRIDRSQKGGLRYLWISLVLLAISIFTGVATFYFITIGVVLLFVCESMTGKTNILPLFLLGLICPAFKYFNNIFGFSVRLWLSEIAGKILSSVGYQVEVTGNMMVADSCEFSVDPACAGLKMMAVSLLVGLLLLAFFERKNTRSFKWHPVLLVMAVILLLNILANLLRIVMLVLFRILPENPAHDMAGIISLIIYVFVPAYFIVKRLSEISFKKPPGNVVSKSSNQRSVIIINILVLIAVAATGVRIGLTSPSATAVISSSFTNGYTKSVLNNDVVKLQKPDALIYFKKIARFYGTEHNPMICWTGSGYEFKQINTRVVKGKEIYVGTLHKGSDIIYAAWWFDNGWYQTIDQLEWRWRAMKGDQFFLVNVNSGSPQKLNEEIDKVLDTKIFNKAGE